MSVDRPFGSGSVPVSPRRAVVALVSLSVAAFCFVTTELLPVGLLTLIAGDLHRSQSATGLLVTGYALVVVVASIPLTRLTRRVPRRELLGGTLAVFVVATAVSAMATGYTVLLVARLLTALTQALFWSVAVPTAARLFPPEVQGRVVARLAIGSAVAPVLGVPTALWLGQQTDWRVPFAVMSGVGLVTGLALVAAVPHTAPEQGEAARGVEPDARRYRLILIVTALGVCGALSAFTYITPFLLEVSHFSAGALGPLLLVCGVAGIGGTLSIGAVLDRYPRFAVSLPLALVTVALLALAAFGEIPAAAVAALALTGFGFNAVPPAVSSRALRVAPHSTDMASAGASAVFNIGIAAGSFLGGALLSGPGVHTVPLVGGLLTAAALAVSLREARPGPRPGPRPGRRSDLVPSPADMEDPCGTPHRVPAAGTGSHER